MDAYRHEARECHLHWRELERLAGGDVSTPVAVAANTTYVASYYAPAGHYSVWENYFTSATTRGPLTALQNGTDGVNGVYKYGATRIPETRAINQATTGSTSS